MRVVIVSGGFDPIHSGHIEHFKEAKKLGDILIVGLNSDEWLTRKKGKPFMPIEERMSVIRELRMVDSAVAFNDDNNSSIDLINKALVLFDDVLFANGGDRTQDNIPEIDAFDKDPRVQFAFGVGGTHKQNSSSWILKKWNST
jgi:D-beta-D-heptose 7-phosphate kinase/D-beta-D-heptose 1-phosphate adenosyltransferase